MSSWCYVNGTVTVSPIGWTQAEKRYILETVLNHLPIVSGSERDMNVYIIQKAGYNCSSSCDEFEERTNNLKDQYGNRSRKYGSLRVQDDYILVVDGALRDREFEQTYREFMKWLIRLCKRVQCEDVLVEIKSHDKSATIKDGIPNNKYRYSVFCELFEEPTWYRRKGKEKYSEPNWCEYLLYDTVKGSAYPMMLAYKYYCIEENDREVERRLDYKR